MHNLVVDISSLGDLNAKLDKWLNNFGYLLKYLEKPKFNKLFSPVTSATYELLMSNQAFKEAFLKALKEHSTKNLGLVFRFYVDGVYDLFMEDYKTDVYLVMYSVLMNIASDFGVNFGDVDLSLVGLELSALQKYCGINLGISGDVRVLVQFS